MKTYRSRVSIILVVLMYTGCLAPGILTYLAGEFKLGIMLALLSITTSILLVFCFGIKYVINGDKLEVHNIGMRQVSIDIHSITCLEENNDLTSAPAASFSRLWVCYGKGERINISPVNQEEFIAEIESIRNTK